MINDDGNELQNFFAKLDFFIQFKLKEKKVCYYHRFQLSPHRFQFHLKQSIGHSY